MSEFEDDYCAAFWLTHVLQHYYCFRYCPCFPSPLLQVVMRLVGANDEILLYHSEKLTWLAETPLLDLLVEQLGPQVRRGAAEYELCPGSTLYT